MVHGILSLRTKMEDIAAILLCVSVYFVCTTGQEMTVPVGLEGNDSVTFIRMTDDLGNYDMGYNENVLTGGASFHREKGYANGVKEGSYGYTTRNGLIRIVTYVADQDGYRAELLTNEPGVVAKDSSNVKVTKEAEPDPTALAQVPAGYQNPQATTSVAQNPQAISVVQSTQATRAGVNPQNEFLSGSDVVTNYVKASALSREAKDSMHVLGTARVSIASPYAVYQYFV